jgi:ribose-phosphate pyrophosphokinase
LALFAGTSATALGEAVAERLGQTLGPRRFRRFPDGEIHVQVEESIRGRDIYLIQSTSPPVNENLAELLITVDAFHRASAGRVTAIVPYYGYARQEKKRTGREPITAKLVADLITTAGADRVVAIDLDYPAIEGLFNICMDHLTAVAIVGGYF